MGTVGMDKDIRIRYTDIMNAIVKRLKTHTGIDTVRMQKDYPRPSFFVKINPSRVYRFGNNRVDRNVSVSIFYFPKNEENPMTELLQMRDTLEDIFVINNIIEINGVNQRIEPIELDEDGEVLLCMFEILITHKLAKDDSKYEYIEEVNLQTELSGSDKDVILEEYNFKENNRR